jgi:hypothetical protein
VPNAVDANAAPRMSELAKRDFLSIGGIALLGDIDTGTDLLFSS